VTFSSIVAAFIRDPQDSKVLPWEFTHLKEAFFNIRLRGQITHPKEQNNLPCVTSAFQWRNPYLQWLCDRGQRL
jgi:hypothetical protein